MEEKTFEADGVTYSRDTLWGTYDGRRIPVRELEDTHVLNLMLYIGRKVLKAKEQLEVCIQDKESDSWINRHKLRLDKQQALLNLVHQESEIRDLDLTSIEQGKSLPFKKGEDWMIWKEGDPRPTKVPNSLDFIKPLDNSEG